MSGVSTPNRRHQIKRLHSSRFFPRRLKPHPLRYGTVEMDGAPAVVNDLRRWHALTVFGVPSFPASLGCYVVRQQRAE